MEAAVRVGKVRYLGIANIENMDQIRELYKKAKVKPSVVYRRADGLPTSRSKWKDLEGLEDDLRTWCAGKGIHFEQTGMLNVNKDAILSEPMKSLAKKYKVTPRTLFRRFTMGQGILTLTKAKARHMTRDLTARNIPLTKDDAKRIDELIHMGE
eukprot:gnl/TRDRNA2_/TRDRNA2_167315_c1_seq2.p1 gnl/TRDRNA2_/TRDRNA2_167315_c1~~gnl/TRDRNA2_/TRDRNA2_167315_c1_seq2.p1  ORF type:complete len:154 (-),score=24.11 gnl/TRDRNA2_/TRDRNA2_167315_c1_seq2:442-903(-)